MDNDLHFTIQENGIIFWLNFDHINGSFGTFDFTLNAHKIVQKLQNIKVFVSKIFSVVFLILLSLKTNADNTCGTVTFQFLDHIKFSNVPLKISTGNQNCSVNLTHFNLYFKQKTYKKEYMRNWLKFLKLIRISHFEKYLNIAFKHTRRIATIVNTL